MRKISRREQKDAKFQNIIQSNMKVNQHQISHLQLDRTDTNNILINNKRGDDLLDDILQLTRQESTKTIQKSRKQLHLIVFFIIIGLQSVFTLYPSFIFTRSNGTYQFAIMQFSFSIIFTFISYYFFIRDYKKLLKIYFMLDSLMIVALCLIACYIFPYVALKRVSANQIIEEIGYFICNISVVGNFRVILLYMEWSVPRVIFYKLSKMFAILFYLIFGTYYVLADISYSKNTDSDTDSKVQDLVILFVFSGFALQLQIFNRTCDFDGTSDLKLGYIIVTQDEQKKGKTQQEKKQQNQQIISEIKQKVKEIDMPKIQVHKIQSQKRLIRIINKPIQIENNLRVNVTQ